MYSTSLLAALTILLAVAVRWDSIYERIPNWASAGGAAVGCSIAVAHGGLLGLYGSLAGAAVGLLCFLPLYLGRGMGAGDVKLMSAVGSFLGPLPTVFAAALAVVAGALIAAAILIRRRSRFELLAGEAAATAPAATAVDHLKTRFPYAIAIAIGTAASILLRGMGLMPGFDS